MLASFLYYGLLYGLSVGSVITSVLTTVPYFPRTEGITDGKVTLTSLSPGAPVLNRTGCTPPGLVTLLTETLFLGGVDTSSLN